MQNLCTALNKQIRVMNGNFNVVIPAMLIDRKEK